MSDEIYNAFMSGLLWGGLCGILLGLILASVARWLGRRSAERWLAADITRKGE